jgi:hypothetical protein
MKMKMKMKRIILYMLPLLLFCCAFEGCNETPTTDSETSRKQEGMQAEAARQVGMPRIVNFTQMKELRYVYELLDQEKLGTFSYVMDIEGRLWHVCDSIGYPMPQGTQFSNPQKHIYNSSSDHGYELPQAEPNGIFPPNTGEATYVICVNPNKPTQTGMFYVEPRVITSPWALHSVGEWTPSK